MSKYFGSRDFYKKVMLIAIPIMIQSGLTNFVNLLDNIMVGRIGAEQMSGVAIVNQLLFVFNLCIFGAVAGAGIFASQFFGKNDMEGVRYTFRFRLYIGAIICAIAIAVFMIMGDEIISLYLKGQNDGGDIAKTLEYGRMYLKIMMFGIPAFMVGQVYSGTLRQAGETVVPMFAGAAAVLTDLVFNYLLIYGKFGFPCLGVEGAAIATSLSRYVEVVIVVFYTHMKSKKYLYIKGMYSSFKIPGLLLADILKKGMPLLLNEALWSAGMAILVQCYSCRGFAVVGGMNISNTISNLFNIAFFSMGDAIAIIIGHLLGAGKMKEARESARKLIVFTVIISLFVSLGIIAASFVMPQFYNVSNYTKTIASDIMRISACFVPVVAFLHATYFTLRSGGNTIITFLFDSVFMWSVSVPAAYIITNYTGLSIYIVFAIVQSLDLIKCIIGYILVKKGIWVNNIVEK